MSKPGGAFGGQLLGPPRTTHMTQILSPWTGLAWVESSLKVSWPLTGAITGQSGAESSKQMPRASHRLLGGGGARLKDTPLLEPT